MASMFTSIRQRAACDDVGYLFFLHIWVTFMSSHYVHQLFANFVCLRFVPGRFCETLNRKQLPAAAKQHEMRAVRVNQNKVAGRKPKP